MDTTSKILPLNQIVTRTSFTLSYDLLKKLKRHAIDNDQTLTAVVNDALYEYLDRRNG